MNQITEIYLHIKRSKFGMWLEKKGILRKRIIRIIIPFNIPVDINSSNITFDNIEVYSNKEQPSIDEQIKQAIKEERYEDVLKLKAKLK